MFFASKKDCAVCGAEAVHELSIVTKPRSLWSRSDDRYVCREHFLSGFKDSLLSHTGKLIVTYPVLTQSNAVYGFYLETELQTFNWTKEDVAVVSRILQSIPEGKVAYYGRETSQNIFGPYGQSPHLLEKVQCEYLTKDDAWNEIFSAFHFSERRYTEGFTPAFHGDGIFLSSLL